MVYAPISGPGGTTACDLVALNGSTGEARWHYQIRPTNCTIHAVADPEVRDFTGDGTPELAIGIGRGQLALLEQNGTMIWNQTRAFSGSVTWMAVGPADTDPAIEIVAATTGGEVVLLDGRTGTVQWTRNLGAYAAVDALADGDGDGQAEVYAVARDGKLRAIAAGTGQVEWTRTLTTNDVQMMPPRLGNVDGDEASELVAVTNKGLVSVVDPASGAVRATYQRDVPIWEHPEPADIDGDGVDEIFVIYADGRVIALSGG